MSRVLVVGGGFAGLACAFRLRRAGRDVQLFEAREEVGGVVGTHALEGFRFEDGPNTVPSTAGTFLALCDELRLRDRLLGSTEQSQERYLWFQGRLQPLPRKPSSFLKTPLLSWKSKLWILSEPLRPGRPSTRGTEPSFEALLQKRLGREATRRLAGAFVRGVYGGEIAQLGARSAFPRLWRMLEQHGSLLRGLKHARRSSAKRAREVGLEPGSLVSFPSGLRELSDALRTHLGASVRTASEVRAVHAHPHGFRLELSGGRSSEGAQVVLATPARQTRRLLKQMEPDFSLESLADIPHASIAVVHVGFAPGAIGEPPRGFGFLVPPEAPEGAPRTLGMLFSSQLFPRRAPTGAFAITAMYRQDDSFPTDDDRAVDLARADLALALGRPEVPAPKVSRVVRWGEILPQYGVGHRERVLELQEQVAKSFPGLFLAGTYTGGVSVDAVLSRGTQVAQQVLGDPGHKA